MGLAEEPAVGRLLEAAREQVIAFATADWLDLAPDLVDELQEILRPLAPGVTFSEAHPDWFSDGAQAPAAPPPPSAPSSVPSPAAPLPISHTVSSGSGVSHLVPPRSDAERTARRMKRLPRAALPAAAASTSDAPPAASTRSKVGTATVRPGDRPEGWEVCTRCKKMKKGCSPPLGADPQDPSCHLCLRAGVTCTRDSTAAGMWLLVLAVH